LSEALGLKVRAAVTRVVASLLPSNMEFPKLPQALEPVAQELQRIGRLTDPRNVYMYCLACRLD
jgi:hypothetical protein